MIRLDRVFTEPLLEFGGGGCSSDIRDGLLRFGPVDAGTPKAKEIVRLGFVGSPKTVAAFTEWMKQCGAGLSGDDPLNPNFAPRFPGLDPTAGFRCRFATAPSWVTEVTEAELKVEGKKPGAVIALTEFFHQRIKALFELSAAKPDVVICLPPDLVRKIVKPKTFSEDDDEEEQNDSGVDFHDYLKALCLQTQSKFQLIWPRTYAESSRGVQDPATRAWNLFAALFYKAGGIPWKLQRPTGAQSTCYVGISFARREEGGYMHSSLTQVFNDKGEGTILRGGMAKMSDEDHEVHLPKDSAQKLLADAIRNFASANDQKPPDRVVIHKSSGYDQAELDGFNEAAEEAKVRFRDFTALTRAAFRLFRIGTYPPLRGTHIILDEMNSLLYTRGSVAFYRKHPGPYVPRTLHIRYYQTDRTQSDIAAEILALTKLNWNKTQFDSFYPITLGGSRRIGEIYRWCANPPGDPITYAHFM
ncbi:hypothetical protein OH491_22375 [Termitidicoccus mucosus]|uniref:Protein argonaute n=1 Tax=Termitidicoccus mucosus TaxID=1184151 RepID=A0A178IPJ0_9BACT|nr:hypothetical protein AW736_04100 [Opitutaceae bacterium TSB47]